MVENKYGEGQVDKMANELNEKDLQKISGGKILLSNEKKEPYHLFADEPSGKLLGKYPTFKKAQTAANKFGVSAEFED